MDKNKKNYWMARSESNATPSPLDFFRIEGISGFQSMAFKYCTSFKTLWGGGVGGVYRYTNVHKGLPGAEKNEACVFFPLNMIRSNCCVLGPPNEDKGWNFFSVVQQFPPRRRVYRVPCGPCPLPPIACN